MMNSIVIKMDKETVEKKIKYALELFKVYTILLIAVGTGVLGLLLKNSSLETVVEKYLLVIGIVSFIVLTFVFVRSFIIINKLYQKL